MGNVYEHRSLGMEVTLNGNDTWTIEVEAGVSIPGHCKKSKKNSFNSSFCAHRMEYNLGFEKSKLTGSLQIRNCYRRKSWVTNVLLSVVRISIFNGADEPQNN